MNVHIIRGDARALPLADGSVDAVVCDPPYELGFMGRTWDSTGVAYDPATWTEALRVLKPGGHLLAFGGMRTQHRLICAIEDAGFDIRDAVVWHFSTGFPKSLAVDKAIDKAAGAEREVVGDRLLPDGRPVRDVRGTGNHQGWDRPWKNDDTARERNLVVTAPATDEARRWQGFGTALKPASEIICVARKPLAGKTVAQNVLAYGCGALNIDATRVTTTDNLNGGGYSPGGRLTGLDGDDRSASAAGMFAAGGGRLPGQYVQPSGRWPSNVVFSHVALTDVDGQVIGDACADGCVDGCPVAALDAQTGTLTSGANPTRHGTDKFRNAYGDFTGQSDCTPARGADSGGASRFFPAFRYCPKADDWERPVVDGIAHPTVKPLDLIRWLVRLVTQPDGLVLDMFAGSGTTVEAALLEQFRVIGVENWEPYLPLIRYRVDRARRRLQPGIARLGKAKPAAQTDGQAALDLFGELLTKEESPSV